MFLENHVNEIRIVQGVAEIMDRLLIIDTEKFDRDIMNRIFGSTYSTDFAFSAEGAASAMKRFEPGVVFFELRQADIAQLALIFDAKAKYCPNSALIVAASENTRELERYARLNSVFYYMLRPFNLKELWDAIEWGFLKQSTVI